MCETHTNSPICAHAVTLAVTNAVSLAAKCRCQIAVKSCKKCLSEALIIVLEIWPLSVIISLYYLRKGGGAKLIGQRPKINGAG